jgi:Zn-dependent alcohol dehydrogenase
MNGIVFAGEPVVRDDVGLRPPEPREVLVRIVNAGLCHSDISVLDGTIPFRLLW